jgi:integrase
MIYELGCRVGEFVRIQLKHLSFPRSSVYIPAENTKTKQRRVSSLPAGLMNEIKSMLRQERRMAKRAQRIFRPNDFLFFPGSNPRKPYSENRIRQIFSQYIRHVGLDREYARDSQGRALHELTVHSLRHSHIMHYVHVFRLPLPIVQKQVGHTSLKTTSVYLRPTTEQVGRAYTEARHYAERMTKQPQALYRENALSFYNDTTKPEPDRQ